VSEREVVLVSLAWGLVFCGLLAFPLSAGFVTRLALPEEDTERGLMTGCRVA
jgi:hypothetical protein